MAGASRATSGQPSPGIRRRRRKESRPPISTSAWPTISATAPGSTMGRPCAGTARPPSGTCRPAMREWPSFTAGASAWPRIRPRLFPCTRRRRRGDTKRRWRRWRPCSKTGRGVAADPGRAFALWQRAAAAGDREGMLGLGWAYRQGTGVEKDPAKALDWMSRAAEAGSGEAMVQLGFAHEIGEGRPRDDGKALDYYRRAAALDHPTGVTNLALMHLAVRGTKADPAEAVRLLERAMRLGDARGRLFLG